MSARLRVALIGGGQNCEHEVSLASAASVRAALDPARYEAVPLTILRDGRWLGPDEEALGSSAADSLAAALAVLAGCDVVLPLLHGPRGEDGTLAALCELAGLPCAGSPTRAGALTMDKWATKLVAEAVGVRTAPGRLVTEAEAAAVLFDGPVVVKPVAAGSSFGVCLVETEEALEPALRAALALDDRVLVEQVVRGREIDVAVLDDPDHGRRVGPPLEILVAQPLFDTTTKYDGSAEFVIPAPLTGTESKALTEAALRVYDALGCRGLARVDFFLTAEGLVLNEVNTMPGLTAESQVPKMFAAEGLPYPEFLDRLIRSTPGLAR
ncbi:D-alanine--D-alanine ligase family protein [Amycolatopsis sp. 195334CR]|uniref:D-alanine--D-alanine ligase family protein n=1 Tax=Amycolatopsis sp. 195334CR TaxID=2814588 RepID=UPI001A8EB529|nr:D-alanine--D-alanine ligase family protein [Amycolatopsis sp. 195334CR]MBN6038345.1 D-alanine--D-alanine ligase [Amycolatopsis sp. 195334CR]